MNRNIAFLITTNKTNTNIDKAKEHLSTLKKGFNYNIKEINTHYYSILILHEGVETLQENGNSVEFNIGNINSAKIENDRYLKISINNQYIFIENDYAGTIPVYYSKRDYLVLSNIEPCTVLGSKTTQSDVSYENIYGFMRFMHFIWDETAYNHINTILPDTRYTFDGETLTVKDKYLETVKSTAENSKLTDEDVADSINKLNDKLVHQSLEKYDQIILPLSSGYDSRMILASLCKRTDLKEKLFCFTYGSEGSVEVEASRRLTEKLGVKWDFIDLPLEFLSKDYLLDIHNIFGSSLHMHGMYQLEFFKEIEKRIIISDNSCLTSGFMTGVPAGQHNSLLNITNNKSMSLTMNKFSQSNYWSECDLNSIEVFKGKNYHRKAEDRFQKAFERFKGTVYQKAVMFDVWTRQRNFISYYPRTLEWKIPVISPHMNKEYVNFFMSISKSHLDDRRAIELMFTKHYPNISGIVSNSNGLKSINGVFDNIMFSISRYFRVLRINFMLPKKYQNNRFEFNTPSVRYSKKDSLHPLLNTKKKSKSIVSNLISNTDIRKLYDKAYGGDVESYEKLTTLQSLSLSELRMVNSNEY